MFSHPGETLVPFGKGERVIAAVCMAIPFFLIISDSNDPAWWVKSIGITVCSLMLVPVIGFLHESFSDHVPRIAAFLTTIAAGFILYLVYLFFVTNEFVIRPSISQYVDMVDAHLFGLLLAVPAMLFIVNGFIYGLKFEDENARWYERWRSKISVIMGIALMGVVVIPYFWVLWVHLACAIVFYLAGGIVILAGLGEEKDRLASWLSVIVMLISFFLGIWNQLGRVPVLVHVPVTVFGAESIGLWVIGVHYIITSYQRVDRKFGAVAFSNG
jgi:hypothetical protein